MFIIKKYLFHKFCSENFVLSYFFCIFAVYFNNHKYNIIDQKLY